MLWSPVSNVQRACRGASVQSIVSTHFHSKSNNNNRNNNKHSLVLTSAWRHDVAHPNPNPIHQLAQSKTRTGNIYNYWYRFIHIIHPTRKHCIQVWAHTTLSQPPFPSIHTVSHRSSHIFCHGPFLPLLRLLISISFHTFVYHLLLYTSRYNTKHIQQFTNSHNAWLTNVWTVSIVGVERGIGWECYIDNRIPAPHRSIISGNWIASTWTSSLVCWMNRLGRTNDL